MGYWKVSWAIFVFFGAVPLIAEEGTDPDYKTVHYYLLNKVTGQRQNVSIPLNASLKINDLRIVPLGCWREKHPLRPNGDYQVPTQVFWEQGEEGADDILIYEAELSTNRHEVQPPLEHPIFDIILNKCE